jgi:hypothetical protein
MAKLSHGGAVELLAETMAEVVGLYTEAYRDLIRAVKSDEMMDMILAQSSFDALPGETRRKIAARVEELIREHTDA